MFSFDCIKKTVLEPLSSFTVEFSLQTIITLSQSGLKMTIIDKNPPFEEWPACSLQSVQDYYGNYFHIYVACVKESCRELVAYLQVLLYHVAFSNCVVSCWSYPVVYEQRCKDEKSSQWGGYLIYSEHYGSIQVLGSSTLEQNICSYCNGHLV